MFHFDCATGTSLATSGIRAQSGDFRQESVLIGHVICHILPNRSAGFLQDGKLLSLTLLNFSPDPVRFQIIVGTRIESINSFRNRTCSKSTNHKRQESQQTL